MEKKPFISKKQWLQGITLGIWMIIITFTIIYFQSSITVSCPDGNKEAYLKSEIHQAKEICGSINIYKYNDNLGLGAYFPDKDAVNRIILEEQNKPREFSFK